MSQKTTIQRADPCIPGGQADSPATNKGLARSIGKNTVFGIGCNLAQMITRFVTVPIVIAHLGLDGYGIWSIVMTVAAYMRFGSVGAKSAFQKYVAEATGSRVFEKASVLISTGAVAILVLSVLGLIPIAVFSSALARSAGVPKHFLESSSGAISLLAVIMVISNAGSAYEAVVMGGHRIDLSRKFGTLFTVVEAIAIVAFLHFGFGLFAMAAVMAASDLCYVICHYVAARRVLPHIHIRFGYFSWSVVPELLRFAGSYQLVSILEVLYAAILPVAVLKCFGAEATGIFAVSTRLVTAALLAQEALLQPILSGGSMVYGSGSVERMRLLIAKSFKWTVALTLPPLVFISVFGPKVVLAWTGRADGLFRGALVLISLAGFFKALSLLQLVLYRVSGKSVLDNIRQVLRIVILLVIGVLGPRLGFYGILCGLAIAEFAGMAFMFFALTRTFDGFTTRMLIPDTVRLLAATVLVIGIGFAVFSVPFYAVSEQRSMAAIQLAQAALGCAIFVWPALLLTGSLSRSEMRTILGFFSKKVYANI